MKHPFGALFALTTVTLMLLSLPLTIQAQGGRAAGDSANSLLSPAQKSQVETRQSRFQKDLAALRSDKKMTNVQKQVRYQAMLQAMDADMLAILTPAQRDEVLKQRQINAQFQKSLDALRTDTQMTDAQKQAQYKTLMQSRQEALLATLTPSERTRVEKEHQAEMARASEVNRLGEQIQKSETPEQVKKIHTISLATRQQMQAVMAEKSLSEQAKVARITELRKQAQTKINKFLTPAQRAQFAHLQTLVSTVPAP